MKKGTKKLGRPFKTVKPSRAGYVLAATLGVVLGIVFMILSAKPYQTSCESDLRLWEAIRSGGISQPVK